MRHVVLISLLVVIIILAYPVAAEDKLVVHVKWKDPYHIQELDLVYGKPRTDNNNGRYMVQGEVISYPNIPKRLAAMRFHHEVYYPVSHIIFFYDTRVRAPEFPTGYQGLWLMQGGSLGPGSGACTWGVLSYGETKKGTYWVNVSLEKDIGRGEASAVYAVLSYGGRVQPLSTGITVKVSRQVWGPVTLVSTSLERGWRDSVPVVVCGCGKYTFYVEAYGAGKVAEYNLTIPCTHSVTPAAKLPGSTSALVYAAAGTGILALGVLILARKR